MQDEVQKQELSIESRLEALLFVSPFPTPLSQFATVLEVTTRTVEKAVEILIETYRERGIRLQLHAGKAQLVSAPEASQDVQTFLNLESTTRLTKAALEVLSIVAYLGPVTRPQIDAIRGVNSDSVLRTILRYGLIEETGRSEGPGRPFLYAVTSEFLQSFGLESLDSLPKLGVTLDVEQRGALVETDSEENDISMVE
ncbi:MAG: SMC-Scp complex subunit ScpB [Anaerolineales bacterium]|nr:SMC-Scp complex subunit ScpB [Anaerolineales bacterium]